MLDGMTELDMDKWKARPHFIDVGGDGQVMLPGHAFGDGLDGFFQKNGPLSKTRSCHFILLLHTLPIPSNAQINEENYGTFRL
jgi:hypothetical protein